MFLFKNKNIFILIFLFSLILLQAISLASILPSGENVSTPINQPLPQIFENTSIQSPLTEEKIIFPTQVISPNGDIINISIQPQKINKKLDSELGILSKGHKFKDLKTLNLPPDYYSTNLIPVFIKVKNDLSEDQIDQIKKLGGKFTEINNNILHFNDIYKITIPTSAIENLSNLEFISKVEYGLHEYKPLLDVSVPRIGATTVWTKNDSQNIPIRGNGILIADIDSGIDFNHTFFYYQNGTSKIRKIWDQTTGEICTRENLTKCKEKDTDSHGTHVSGIILGGIPGVTQYVGVAPDAELLMIKGWSIADGIYWAVNEGAKIILIEYGSWISTPRDGSTADEQAIDWATSQNVTVIVPAGNLGGSGYHSSPVANNNSFTPFRFSLSSSGVSNMWLTILWRNPNDNLGIWFEPPNTNSPILLGWLSLSPYCYTDSTIGMRYCFSSSISSRNTAEIDVSFSSTSSELPTGTWYLWLDAVNFPIPEASRQTEAYLSFSGYSWSGGGNFLDYVNDYYTVTSPATADTAISVASFVTRSLWPWKIGTISSFSSRGPRIDGVSIPHISAPGECIYSSVSKDAGYPPNSYDCFSGTSMAGPHVAGAIALLLQQDPTLLPYQIKNILYQTTEPMSSCSSQYECGYGLIRSDNIYTREVNLYWHDQSPSYVNLGLFNVSAYLKNANSVSATNVVNDVILLNSTGIRFASGETGSDFVSTYPAGADWLFYYRLNATQLGKYWVGFNLKTDNMGNHKLVFSFDVVDLSPPVWFQNTTFPKSGTIYAPEQQYSFNISWIDNVGVSNVLIENNFTGVLTNYTMANSSSTYYYNYKDLPAGVYVWRVYANDTSNNWNKTDQWVYIVNKSTPGISLLLNGTSANYTASYGEAVNITVILNTSQGFVNLYKDGTLIQAGPAPLTNISVYTAPVGTQFNITTFYDETQNYTSDSKTLWIVIDPYAPTYSIPAIIIPSFYNPNFITNFTVYWTDNKAISKQFIEENFTGILKNTTMNTTYSIILPAGTFQYRYLANDTSNNWGTTDISYLTVNPQTIAIHLALNGSEANETPYEYPATINATGWKLVDEGTIKLYRNGTEVNNPDIFVPTQLGSWNYTLIYSQANNYTALPVSRIAIVQDTIPPILSNIFITPSIVKPNSNITVFSTIIDSGIGMDYAYLTGYNSSWYQVFQAQNLTQSGNNWFLTFNVGNASEGTYYFNITAVDKVGNSKTVYAGDVIINQTSGATGIFTDASISTTNNQTTINATQATNTTLEIMTNQPVSNASVSIASYTKNPGNVNFRFHSLNKYVEIKTSPQINDSLLWVIIKIYYSDSDVPSTINESSLRIFYFDGRSWIPYNPPYGGVNVTENYVWANSTHFSLFGVGGLLLDSEFCNYNSDCNSNNCASDYSGLGKWCAPTGYCAHDGITTYMNGVTTCYGSYKEICNSGSWSSEFCYYGCSNGNCNPAPSPTPTPGPTGGGGAGGGAPLVSAVCEENWTCSSWSECYPNGTQYRTCKDLNNCNTTKNKPVEKQACTYTPATTSTTTITIPTTTTTLPPSTGITGFFAFITSPVAIVAIVIILVGVVGIFLLKRVGWLKPKL
jgi:subtilisin family serine protease